MRVLGALLFVLGALGVGWSVRELDRRKRPQDVAFAVLAPIAAVTCLLGLTLLLVPGFL